MSASSPEELETLLEDAVLLGDEAAVTALFEQAAVIVNGPSINGRAQALPVLAPLEYVASAIALTVRHDLALMVGEHTINVCCQGSDGTWRLLIALVRPAATPCCSKNKPGSTAGVIVSGVL